MSKYKVGDKVVMKIISADQDEIKTYSVSGVNDDWRWCLPQNLLERYTEPLSTYTETLEAKIRRQAAEITRLLEENKELKEESKRNYIANIEMARAEGHSEAWELARKIVLKNGYSAYDLHEIFNCCGSHQALEDYTYPEAVAKVAEWEKAKEEIKVGDVYRSKVGNYFAIRTTDGEKGVAKILFMSNGEVTPDYIKSYCTKTGRRIDIDSFLKQIRGEQE